MKNLFSLALLFTQVLIVGATHLRSGDISVKRISETSYTCTISITVYTNTGSAILFGGMFDYLDFGDGTSPVLVPETPSLNLPELGPGVGQARYIVNHTFPGPGRYTISYTEPNRNGGILNFDNSISTPFYIETTIILDESLNFTSTPDFLLYQFFIAKIGEPFALAIGATIPDDEDYVIRYELGTPKRERNQPVSNYKLPENLKLNPFTGLLTWDTKFLDGYFAGEYLFTVRINLSKEIDGKYYRLCTVEREMQIILDDNNSGARLLTDTELDENNRVYVSPNESRTITIELEPYIPNSSQFEVFSTLDSDAVNLSVQDQGGFKVGVLTLNSIPQIDRDNPYVVIVRGKQTSGSFTLFAQDICFLFYTRDLFPAIITRTEEILPDISITPNPVTDFLKIQLTQSQPIQLTLLNQSGKIVLKNIITESSIIDMRGFQSGLYLVEIRTSRGRKVTKVIKH